MRDSFFFAILLASFFICSANASNDGVLLEVTAGKVSVTDWVAEVNIDLATAKKLLSESASPDKIAIMELDDSGKTGAVVMSQVDPTGEEGIFTISWRVPGELKAGKTRHFLLAFDSTKTPDEWKKISTIKNKGTITVQSGKLRLTHTLAYGGMIRNITLGRGSADFYWCDKIYDGTEYQLANHPAKRMKVLASGPLRVCFEVVDEYQAAGKQPKTKPIATYRFTTYAGLPFTNIKGSVTQDFAHPWRSVHFIEMQLNASGMTHYVTDKISGELVHAGQLYPGMSWSAVYKNNLLVAVCGSKDSGVWDGGGDYYGAYLRGSVSMNAARDYEFQSSLLYGNGYDAIKDGTVQQWADVIASPPKVRVNLSLLEKRIENLERTINNKRNTKNGQKNQEWAVAHVSSVLAAGKLSIARECLSYGRFKDVIDALDRCRELLDAPDNKAILTQVGGVVVGMAIGSPFLANDRVAYVWSTPDQGCGLISIFDIKNQREFLRTNPPDASLWELAFKSPDGGKDLTSIGTPCKASFEIVNNHGIVKFEWEKDNVTVDVTTSLTANEPMLRSQIKVKNNSGTLGLTSVIFPKIKGITPLSAGDMVLETASLGNQKPSPLVSGTSSSTTDYPHGMQFTALLGNGLGLYFAEEDGQANRKYLTWTANNVNRTLSFSISHPVLNWAAKTLVKEYKSPGDIVCGPFNGDWYDAARIYRKWALTAPWCAKGPIYKREDYPKWLLKAAYWTISDLGDETGIQRELDKQKFYEIPTMITHAYGYYFQMLQDDRYPQNWPPKLGSEGFKKTVKKLQSKGIRIIPYVQGWLWDTDTDSFRMEDGKNKAALISGEDGQMLVMTNYGYGQKLAGMCPATKLWRKKMLGMVQELVGRYGVDGIYFDFLTAHTSDCYNTEHGHAIGGGNYWTKAVHGLYEDCRDLAKKLNPDAILTGEDPAEYCIDVHDTFLCSGKVGSTAPLFQAVYHGYANLFGAAMINGTQPVYLGRYWLLGIQNGWHNSEGALIGKPPHQSLAKYGQYYKKLLKCRWDFGTPYLGYGEMLRPPKIDGNLSVIEVPTTYEPLKVQAVEGSVWKAPDGTVGMFLLNYDENNTHEVEWSIDLGEAGIDKTKKIRISRWTPEKGLVAIGEYKGGLIKEKITIEPLGIVALKLEVIE